MRIINFIQGNLNAIKTIYHIIGYLSPLALIFAGNNSCWCQVSSHLKFLPICEVHTHLIKVVKQHIVAQAKLFIFKPIKHCTDQLPATPTLS